MISPEQCRAARAWLDLERKEFADIVGCHRDTILGLERQGNRPRIDIEDRIRRAFQARGIIFTFTRDGHPLGIESSK